MPRSPHSATLPSSTATGSRERQSRHRVEILQADRDAAEERRVVGTPRQALIRGTRLLRSELRVEADPGVDRVGSAIEARLATVALVDPLLARLEQLHGRQAPGAQLGRGLEEGQVSRIADGAQPTRRARGRARSALGSRSSARTFSAICAGEVAPNSTLVTAGFASAKPSASVAGLSPTSLASCPQRAARLAGLGEGRRFRIAPRLGRVPPRVVLAGEHAARQREGRHHAGARCRQCLGHLRALDPVPAHQAVRQLGRARRGHALLLRGAGRLEEGPGLPVHDPPCARLAGLDQPGYGSHHLRHRQAVGRRVGVDQVDLVESHAAERAVQLLSGALPRPELPPELVRDDGLVALPAASRNSSPKSTSE